MTSSRHASHVLLSLVLTIGCAVAQSEEPNPGEPVTSAGRATSGGKASVAGGAPGQAGTSQGGSGARAGQAGSEDAGRGGSSGAAGGKSPAHGGGALGGTGGASGGSSGSGGGPAPGTLLFMDDFETADAAGWQTNTTGDWTIALDAQNHVYRQPTTTDVLHISWVSGTWQNIAVEAKVKVLAFGGTNDQDIVCLYARVKDDRNHYSLAIRPNGRVAIRKRVDGQNTTIGSSQDAGVVVSTWYTVKLEVSGTTLKAYVDGTLINTQTDAALSAGGIGLGGDNSSAEFDDVVVTAL